MVNITKRFPGVLANDHIFFELKKGEVHALLGENGAGKTTLMNILYGLYEPDEGEIYVGDKMAQIKSPEDALELGIGMVHQHFMLILPFTVAENIALGLARSLKDVSKEVANLSERYGLKIDPQARISQLSMGERQRVEIIKALYRGGNVLILDEPTSVLTPQETKELFKVLRSMANEGRSVILITHKLREVMEVSDRVTVLRRGRVVATKETVHVNEKELAKMMVGREVRFELARHKTKSDSKILEVEKISALGDDGLAALKDVSFCIFEGEILGVAGISGNGQRELAEVIMGLRKVMAGRILINSKDMTNRSPREVINEGVGYIPENIMMALIPDLSVAENAIFGKQFIAPFITTSFLLIGKNLFLNYEQIDKYAKELVSVYDIKTTSIEVPVSYLSGGNMKRLILARELSRKPKLLIAAYPTSGLDISATEYVRQKLVEQREKGTAILLTSEDLDEILSLSDRIMIMHAGDIMGIIPTEKANVEDIGLMMSGIRRA